ncbi:hypothetical protein [Pseudomonas putida]|uniref:hypothetical protein n=1 Tax=Pseudomonas putida TaxID=303 RepID=UPI003D99795E
MNTGLVNAHVQECAIQFISYRGPLNKLVGFIAHSMGDSAPSLEELTHYLQKETTHTELLKREVGLWKNTTGDWSLVSLATPQTIEAMRYRLEHFPTSNTQCRWCLQDSKRLAYIDLVPEKDIHGLPVHRSLLHKQCMRPWLTMRQQVARAGIKESL